MVAELPTALKARYDDPLCAVPGSFTAKAGPAARAAAAAAQRPQAREALCTRAFIIVMVVNLVL